MSILVIILSIIGGIIALVLIIALFAKKGYNTNSEITIAAPRQKVYDYLKQIKNQDHFNIWVMMDPVMKKTFKGTDGTVGFIYGWNGNKKAGEGEQEIKGLVEGKSVETEIRFARPMPGVAFANMSTESLPDNQTKVSWTTSSTMKYPLNIMSSMITKMLEKDMAISLGNLKSILEK